jgi:hypothetical protein
VAARFVKEFTAGIAESMRRRLLEDEEKEKSQLHQALAEMERLCHVAAIGPAVEAQMPGLRERTFDVGTQTRVTMMRNSKQEDDRMEETHVWENRYNKAKALEEKQQQAVAKICLQIWSNRTVLALYVTDAVLGIGAVLQKRQQAKVMYAYLWEWWMCREVLVQRDTAAVILIQASFRNSRKLDTGTIREVQRGCEQDTPSSSGELTSPPEVGVGDERTHGACAGRLQPDCQQSSEEENVEESTDKSSGNKQPQVPFSIQGVELPVPDDSSLDSEVLETVGVFSPA